MKTLRSFFRDYLLIRWNSPNLQLGPSVSSSRQQVLLRQPVNNKYNKVAVRCEVSQIVHIHLHIMTHALLPKNARK